MRKQFCEHLAVYAGQTLTQEVALALVRDLFPDASLDVASFGVVQYGEFTFQVEQLRDVWGEMQQLHTEHHMQTDMGMTGYAFTPDRDDLLERERAGRLLQCTARNKNGLLVGHMRAYLTTSIQTNTLVASDAAFYVTPAYRGGFMALRLWQFTEACAVAAGAKEIYCETRLVNGVDKMAKRLNYKPVAMVHCKIIPKHIGANHG
ncbi:MAG: hypothetical protein H7293_18235 [Candidatus Saccharibacteria bacterium]|nr:hypothetical protein [Rhodoferax sp.]